MGSTEPERACNQHRPHQARHPSFYQGVVFTGAGTAINIALLFLETMIAARLLEAESFGVYVLLVMVVNILVMVVDLGFTTALTQLMASSDSARKEVIASSAMAFRIALIAVISAIIWLARDALLLLDQSGALLEYAAYIPAMLAVASLDELFMGALQGLQAYHHMAVAQIVRSVLRVALSIFFLAMLRLGVIGLIYSWIISFTASATYQYFVLPLQKRLRCNRSLLGELLRFGLPLQGNRLLWFVSGEVNVMLLGVFMGPTGVAYYNIGARIPSALVRLAQSYTAVFFPTMTELLTRGKRRQACWLLDDSLRLISFTMALIALGAVLFSQQIITLLFSAKYAASSVVFAVLMIALHMTLLVNLMGYALTSAGRPGRSLGASVIRTGLTVAGDMLLIPPLGFVGPAWASTISYYVTNPICVWLLRRSGISVTVAPYIKQTILLWLCIAIFWWMRPTEFVYKVAIIVAFLVLNLVLSTVSVNDLRIVLPRAAKDRLGVRRETASDESR